MSSAESPWETVAALSHPSTIDLDACGYVPVLEPPLPPLMSPSDLFGEDDGLHNVMRPVLEFEANIKEISEGERKSMLDAVAFKALEAAKELDTIMEADGLSGMTPDAPTATATATAQADATGTSAPANVAGNAAANAAATASATAAATASAAATANADASAPAFAATAAAVASASAAAKFFCQAAKHATTASDGLEIYLRSISSRPSAQKGQRRRQDTRVSEASVKGTKKARGANLASTQPPAASSTGGAAISCPVCEKRFLKRSNLQVHLRNTHKGERQFECYHDGCSEKFSGRAGLQKHLKSAHPKPSAAKENRRAGTSAGTGSEVSKKKCGKRSRAETLKGGGTQAGPLKSGQQAVGASWLGAAGHPRVKGEAKGSGGKGNAGGGKKVRKECDEEPCESPSLTAPQFEGNGGNSPGSQDTHPMQFVGDGDPFGWDGAVPMGATSVAGLYPDVGLDDWWDGPPLL